MLFFKKYFDFTGMKSKNRIITNIVWCGFYNWTAVRQMKQNIMGYMYVLT